MTKILRSVSEVGGKGCYQRALAIKFVLWPGLILTNILRSVSELGGEGVLSARVSEQVWTKARFDYDQHFEECVRGGGRRGATSDCLRASLYYDQV